MSSFRKSCLPSDLVLSVVVVTGDAFAVVWGTWTWFRNVDEEMSVIACRKDLSRGSGAVIDAQRRRARRSDAWVFVGGRSGFNGAIPATWAGLLRRVLALLARLALSEIGRAWVGLTAAATAREIELAAARRRVHAHDQALGADALGRQRVAQLRPTGLNKRTRGGVFYVDVELQGSADAVAQRDFHTTKVLGVQLDAHAAIARQPIEIGLVGDLGDDFGRSDMRWQGDWAVDDGRTSGGD